MLLSHTFFSFPLGRNILGLGVNVKDHWKDQTEESKKRLDVLALNGFQGRTAIIYRTNPTTLRFE